MNNTQTLIVMNTKKWYLILNFLYYHPKYVELVTIEPSYMNKDFGNILIAFKKEIENYGQYSLERLGKLYGIDINLFGEIVSAEEIPKINKDNYFKSLEKDIINEYQIKTLHKMILENKPYEEIAKEITTLNEINICENDFITANDMKSTMTDSNNYIELGYTFLDYTLNLHEKDLLIIAGGTGVGKTAFGLNLLCKLSKKYQCIYFNMEMGKQTLYKRIIGIETGIELKDLNDITKLNEENKNKVWKTMKGIEERKIALISESMTIPKIERVIANIKSDKHKIVFVDHIGLINSKGNSIYEKTTYVAKALRQLCITYGCTVISLCQLSRQTQKENTMPKLQDLKDSGEVEQSARKVLILYSPEQESQKDIIPIKMIIAKNDDGRKGCKDFEFERNIQKFSEKYN